MTSRSLTDNEIKLAKAVFGDAIDYSTVKIHDTAFFPFQAPGISMAPNGNLYMHGTYCNDYAREDPYRRSLFIHEMTHVWQFQNKVLNPVVAAVELNVKHKFNYFAAYCYRLDEKKTLTDYGMEQQAAIVQEYFLMKHEGITSSDHCTNKCSATEKKNLYEKVLEKFLENPAYARQTQFPKVFKRKNPKP